MSLCEISVAEAMQLGLAIVDKGREQRQQLEEKEEEEKEPEVELAPVVESIEDPVVDEETATAGMTEVQKRLFKIRMRMNQGRKNNKVETENEYKRFADPQYESKQRYHEKVEEEKKARAKFNIGREIGEGGIEDRYEAQGGGGAAGDDPIMMITAEAAERKQEKIMLKEKNMATFGLQSECSDSQYKSYKNKLSKLPSSSISNGSSSAVGNMEAQQAIAMQYGRGGAVTKAGKDRLSKDIIDHQEHRKSLSRRRMTNESDDVDFINDKNEAFNKKIKRSFDKYTVEIRQNLERGTAI